MNIKSVLEFNKHNIMKLLENVLIFLKNRIYVNDRILLYIFDSSSLAIKEIENKKYIIIKEVNYKNVFDAVSFQDNKYIKRFIDFLNNGDRGYYAYIKNECVHRSWVQFNKKVSFHRFFYYFLKTDEAYIHWCETAEIARGNNVYPLVLQKIVQDFFGYKILITVNKKNYQSIRGIEKAGFIPIREYHVFLILGIKFIIKYNLEKNNE